MKYWAYLGAKLVAVALFMRAVWDGLTRVLPEPEPFLTHRPTWLDQDLASTGAILLFFLTGIGLAYLAVWDQRMRCRSCLRRLRMPLETGSWSRATLLSPPQMESICPYGHGTLTEPEVHTTGQKPAEWTPHDDDIWKELESLDRRK
ncbi:MAG: hypothetical protein ABSC08_14940 [Bryobacteraceae bacterium]|jgi:hypothetical protein